MVAAELCWWINESWKSTFRARPLLASFYWLRDANCLDFETIFYNMTADGRERKREQKNTIVHIQVTEFMNISRPMFELVTKRVHKMLSRPLLFCLLSFNFFLLLSFSPLLLLLFFFFFADLFFPYRKIQWTARPWMRCEDLFCARLSEMWRA